MLKKYIGKSRAENLDWLVNVWLKDGPPVCFLQGFSGVGKTDLARDVRELAEKQQSPDKKPKWQQAVINEVADRATPSVIESLMELSVTLSRQGLPEMERVIFEQKDPNLAYALERALERPVVIILDEAERFFRGDTGAPLPEMNGILSFLRNRQNLPGRLLLLSDRIVEGARWSEWIPKRTLTKLEPDEAVEALDTKLGETGLIVEITMDRKKEVVRDLDFNPRAIEALVAALRYESLDEIIGSNPGLWAVHDREVSRDFLKALEKDLLERTLRHLSDLHQRRLWRLAVHRRSFKREAVEKLCGTKDEANELRSILVTRYLLNFYKGALSVNPIVREISLSHLRDEIAEFQQAHSGAADYHLRHFRAKQIVGSQTQLGESFAELRYHLVMAGRESELGVIGQRFTDHLKQELKSVSPVPTNAEELDERIGVMTALLEKSGAKGLEHYLAKCLEARNKPGDLANAVTHSERATGRGAPCDSWLLYARLRARLSGADEAMKVITVAKKEVSVGDKLAALFGLGAEILAGAGELDKAIALLDEGIGVIPPENNLCELVQSCADLLSTVGKIEGEDGAVALLKQGIKVIPPDKGLSTLYHSCADLLSTVGKIEGEDGAVALLKQGIKVIPPDKGLSTLYHSCADLLSTVGKIEGEDGAVALLKQGIKVIPPDKNLFTLYQSCADLLYRVGKIEGEDGAVALLKQGLPVVPANKTPWPQKGLLYLIERLEPPQIVDSPVFSTPLPGQKAAVDEPDLYVSYAWGDETPDGIQREKVVNEMCDAVANTGRVVGRDKTVMKPGDSIDAFADKIAKAPRIVAVISAKSLHSKFCMVDEIYSAYQRCGFRRDEFRLKVIALVMDDAKPLLTEDIALVKQWKAVHEKERTALLDVDSERKELERWAKLHKLGEMCERLLGMLDAIKDTIMPRGYENIVGGNFQEVIARLPPKRP